MFSCRVVACAAGPTRGRVTRDLIRWIVCGVLLTGCASGQNSQSMTITEDTALVSVAGKPGMSRATLFREAVGEAARITRDHGYTYFVIIGAADAAQTVSRNVPGQLLASRTARPRNTFTASFDPVSTTPGHTVQETRPGLDVTIRMYREGEIEATKEGVWPAAAVLDDRRASGTK